MNDGFATADSAKKLRASAVAKEAMADTQPAELHCRGEIQEFFLWR